jgi:hypothetical protein
MEVFWGIPEPLTITNHLIKIVGGSLENGNFRIASLAYVTNNTKVIVGPDSSRTSEWIADLTANCLQA